MQTGRITIDFSFSGIMSGIVFSAIGLWMIRMAKKKANFSIAFIGLALILYPFFASGWLADWGIGIGLCVLAKSIWER